MTTQPGPRRTRVAASSAFLLTIAFAVGACGSDGDQGSASSQDTIVVGSDLSAPPYAYLDGDKPVGFDPEMVQALADQLGRAVTIKDIRFEQLIPSLNSGQIDLIASDLYITADRAEVVDYIPYFSTGNAIMTRADEEPISDAEGLCGMRVAVIKGGAIVEQLRDEASGACTEADRPAIDVREFPTDPEATQALVSGQVDVHVTDAAICSEIEKKLDGKVVVTSSALLFPVPVGLAVKKGNAALKDALVDALDAITKDGIYEVLLDQYNLMPADEQQVAEILAN